MQAKKPDRLSALISQFRIKATVHPPGGDEGLLDGLPAANLFIARRGDLNFSNERHEPITGPGPKLAFFPRGTPPDIRVQLASRDAEYLRATVDMSGDANPIALALPPLVAVRLDEAPSLAAVADLLLEEALSPRCGGRAVIDRLCEVVVIRLLRHAIEVGEARPGLLAGLAHPNLRLPIVAVHDNPEKSWRLEDLAEIAGMSRTHFANSFRDVVGVTPGGYLSGWRLTLARTEIAKGTPLKIVAGKVGFSSSAALSRAFSRRYGFSPREGYSRSRREAVSLS
jgi:AraC-like DNA-binding protein